ncbi:hypothetical protein VTO73DRAFT_5848 [Trametes versicolor]
MEPHHSISSGAFISLRHDPVQPQAVTLKSSVLLTTLPMARLPSSPSRRTPTAQWPVRLRTSRVIFVDYVKHVDRVSSEALSSCQPRSPSFRHLANLGAASFSSRHLVKFDVAISSLPASQYSRAPPVL